MTMPLHFVLVRHGQSEGNVAQGKSRKGDHSLFTPEFQQIHSSQYHLTKKGKEQAAKAGKWIEENIGSTFKRYYVSEYVRAVETAALLNLPQAKWFKNPFLREREVGDWDGLSELDRQEKFLRHVLARKNDGYFWKPPNGESIAELCLRIHRFLDTVHRGHSDSSVITVCHGEVMWAFRIMLERLSQNKFNELRRSKNPANQIHNGQVIHYTRQNPKDQQDIHPYPTWVRSVCTTDLTLSRPPKKWWKEIERPVYSSEDLLAEAKGVPWHLPGES